MYLVFAHHIIFIQEHFFKLICSHLHVNGIVGRGCTYLVGSKRKNYSKCLDNFCHFSASIFAPRIRFSQ